MKPMSLKEMLELDPVEVVEDPQEDSFGYVENPYENPMGAMECPACGAAPGAECGCEIDDVGNELPDHEHPPDDEFDIHTRPTLRPEGKVSEFDKYMDKILISEGHGRPATKPEDNPQRRRAARHQDRPGNKTRFGVK